MKYEGFEIADGVYELPVGTLKVWSQGDGQWACIAYDHSALCRRCQNISDEPIMAALVSQTIDGILKMTDDPVKGWMFKVTPTGEEKVAEIMARSGRTTTDLEKMSKAELRVFLNGPTR